MSDIVTTSYLLRNLHCASCVAAICSLLQKAHAHHVLRTSPDLVTSVVTVEHRDNPAASVSRMQKTLEDAGFDVGGVRTSAVVADDLERLSLQADPREGSSHHAMNSSTSSLNSWFRFWRQRGDPVLESARAAHLANCEACRSEATQSTALEKTDREILSKIDNTSSESINTGNESLNTEGSFHHLEGVTVQPTESLPPTWRATVSIGGMTCAVCSNTITEELKKIPWITRVVVNLVGNSASIDYTDENRTQDIAEAIEDLGYDATIDKVVNLNEEEVGSRETREVEIKIDGMYCSRCPKQIRLALKNLSQHQLSILREPTTKNPILKLSYEPKAPHSTIRQVLRAIEASDPSLRASIYQPPSLEERSKAIRRKHQLSLIKREILTAIITIPTFILGIVYMTLLPKSNKDRMYLMEPWVSGISRLDISMCLLATPVYFFAADVFHIRAIKEIMVMWRPGSRVPLFRRFWKFGSMNMLISLGTSIAYFSSIAQMIAIAIRDNHHENSGAELYFDSVVFLTLFLLAGKLIESYSKSKAGDAVEMLGKLRPNTALLLDDSSGAQVTTTIPVDQLEFGDRIRVPQGASPAEDGIVTAGETTFDESSLTGESRPIKKGEGDQVFAGTVNQASAITVRVTGTSGRSMLDQIVEVVREGQTRRAPIEQIADLLTTYFVPIITLIAIVTWIVWMILGASNLIPDKDVRAAGGWVAFSLQFAIAVFVVACPCGLGLAAPTAIFVGGGIAAKHGVLAKGGGEAFEKASKIDCVVFDKTGTLTEGGNPQVTDAAIFSTEDKREKLLSVLKAVEESSSHPIAKAVVKFCGATQSAEIHGLEELPGKGMKATYINTTNLKNANNANHTNNTKNTDSTKNTLNSTNDNQTFDILIGNEALMPETIEIPPRVSDLLTKWKLEAKSIALAAIKPTAGKHWTLVAALAISDPIRQDAKAVIGALTSRGTQVWMLSGDNETTARAVAELVGISPDNVIAEVLPSDKAAQISALQASLHASTGHSRRAMVAMVGDGINDAPALATADVGIAIGSGSDVAISSAAFVLATSRLAAVVTLLDLSCAVFRRIRANFAWAIIYNMIAVPVAAGCFWPLTSSGEHVRLDPVWAALAMALSSISVVLSSLSLRTRIPGVGFRRNKDI